MSKVDSSPPVLSMHLLKNTDALGFFYKFVVFSFILSTIFDPADKLLGLKLPLFIACWVVGGIVVLLRHSIVRIPVSLLLYVLLMIVIPLWSITYYFMFDGAEPFEGFLLLRSYLFFSFVILLFITRINAII